jgi:hypothetical protein
MKVRARLSLMIYGGRCSCWNMSEYVVSASDCEWCKGRILVWPARKLFTCLAMLAT